MIRPALTLLVFAMTIGGAIASDEFAPGDTMTMADYAMRNIDDTQLTLADVRGAKGTVVAFWCNHCPYVIKYQDRFKAVVADYAEQGIGFIAVNANDPTVSAGDSFEKMKSRASEQKYAFPYVVDVGAKLAAAYSATRTPHLYVFNSADELVYVGAIDDSADGSDISRHYLREALDAVIAGKPVQTAITKAIGCTIKWPQK